jgi:alpha,alpha-trehalase
MAEARGYRPIADYAAIGDCHGCALVARDGGIDWACFERFDAEPLFFRILDARIGAHFDVRPRGEYAVTRAYVPQTNLLRTVFRTSSGEVAVTDFMPVGRAPGAGANDYVRLRAPGWLARRVEGLQGTVELELRVRMPANAPGMLHSDVTLEREGEEARAAFSVAAGERRFAVIAPADARVDAAVVDRLLETTRAFWREWLSYCRYAGEYPEAVERSALALKLLTYPRTGACVAAFTTSLPERIGGERNWDYRYCWIRDASLMLHALAGIGYAAEAHGFFGFLCERLAPGVENLQVMYGVEGEADLVERILEHLEGYRGSRPVRIGNAAFSQNQVDLYGYILEGAWVYRSLGGHLSLGDRRALIAIADFIEGCWPRPDTGLWESRGPLRHYVHSKAMCWVVLDRAIRLFGARPKWVALRDEIRAAILARGRHPDGHLRQAFDEDAVDAALLQLPALGFALDRETLRRTRLEVQSQLADGDFLERYRTDDGLRGREGAFLVCSFWLVDALLAEGEVGEARGLFERLCAAANDVGLYAEEIDPVDGAFLGNFPQAFTHFGLMNSAVSLELYRRFGAAGIAGGYAERAKRAVRASVGWRGLAAAFFSTGRIRLRSSRESILA